MSNTNQLHTPGPWAVSQAFGFTNGAPRNSFTVSGACGTVAITPNPTIPANAANARLIAAAPELLDALQSIVDAYQRHFDAMPVAWQTFDAIARAAIAKAQGGAA